MSKTKLPEEIVAKAQTWQAEPFDIDTRQQVAHMLKHSPEELFDSFYKDLEFGTGGMRGIMGVGTNRMNRYTIGTATQGLSRYLNEQFGYLPEIRVAIAYDTRNGSKEFARISADVLSANGIRVYLFESIRPTPELSFTIRMLKCHCGIVITASHNPKEYNGYKVYWQDGGQIVYPHDKAIIQKVKAIRSVGEINFNGNDELIQTIGPEIDEAYLNTLTTLSLAPEIVKKQHNLTIVYTPIHGTGARLVPMALRKFGFTRVITIPEQAICDGNFPTVQSPNPEEPAALTMALKKAEEIKADIVMATDPDADRVGIGIRDSQGNYRLLNGNQAASILTYYVLTQWNRLNRLTGMEFTVKTIVTTELLSEISRDFEVQQFNVLTGFKHIAALIEKLNGKKQFIVGGEESYGYLCGDFVRDKDAVLSCAMFAEIAAWAKSMEKTLYDILCEIYRKYGLYWEQLFSITLKGKEGMEQIEATMNRLRNTPPIQLDGESIVRQIDYRNQTDTDIITAQSTPTTLPKSNVIQLITQKGTKVSVRPSGTEPKIKYYISVNKQLQPSDDIESELNKLKEKISRIARELAIESA